MNLYPLSNQAPAMEIMTRSPSASCVGRKRTRGGNLGQLLLLPLSFLPLPRRQPRSPLLVLVLHDDRHMSRALLQMPQPLHILAHRCSVRERSTSQLSAEESTTSDAVAAQDGSASEGASPEECRTVRSLLCGPGSSKRPTPHPPLPLWRSSVPVGRRSAAHCGLLQRGDADGLLFEPEHRTQPPHSSPPSDATSWWSPARISNHCAIQRKTKFALTCLSLVVVVVAWCWCGDGVVVWVCGGVVVC